MLEAEKEGSLPKAHASQCHVGERMALRLEQRPPCIHRRQQRDVAVLPWVLQAEHTVTRSECDMSVPPRGRAASGSRGAPLPGKPLQPCALGQAAKPLLRFPSVSVRGDDGTCLVGSSWEPHNVGKHLEWLLQSAQCELLSSLELPKPKNHLHIQRTEAGQPSQSLFLGAEADAAGCLPQIHSPGPSSFPFVQIPTSGGHTRATIPLPEIGLAVEPNPRL